MRRHLLAGNPIAVDRAALGPFWSHCVRGAPRVPASAGALAMLLAGAQSATLTRRIAWPIHN